MLGRHARLEIAAAAGLLWAGGANPSNVAEHKKSKFVLEKTNELHVPAPALSRNYAGSAMADLCFFVPKETAEVQRSGTWAAWRGARKQSKLCLIIWPNGSIGR